MSDQRCELCHTIYGRDELHPACRKEGCPGAVALAALTEPNSDARIKELEAENAALAAHQCIYPDGTGLTGDDRGNQICIKAENLKIAKRVLTEERDRIKELEAENTKLKNHIGNLCGYPLCECKSDECMVLSIPVPEKPWRDEFKAENARLSAQVEELEDAVESSVSAMKSARRYIENDADLGDPITSSVILINNALKKTDRALSNTGEGQ